MLKSKKIELLAPAGNLEKMKTALAFGADAVYAGIPDFSLRTRINDFDLEKIAEAADFCHKEGKKIYITINVFAHNRHLEKLPAHIKKLKKIKVDALIISDPGIIAITKEIWPEAEIHLSTQANCTNWRAAEFWQAQGVKRVILGRETTLEEIREIHTRVPGLELEYFVHGAMCMAYSGRCFLSAYYAERSANLGDCVQPCRWKYDQVLNGECRMPSGERRAASGECRMLNEVVENKSFLFSELGLRSERGDEFEVVEEEHGSYILNSKDLCLIKYIKQLKEAGISSFKIEGRAKSVYYQALVAGIYARAIELIDKKNTKIVQDEIDFLYGELEKKLVHRGYTTGFLLEGKAGQNLASAHEKSEWEFCGQVLANGEFRMSNGEFRMPNGEFRMPSGEFRVSSGEFRVSSDERRVSNFGFKNVICIKVHNSIKIGDEIEIVKPKYDIIKMKVEKLWDAKNGANVSSAHGGQGAEVLLEAEGVVEEFSVVRRKV